MPVWSHISAICTYIYIYIYIYGGVYFAHLHKPFTAEKRTEVLLLRHYSENVIRPSTIKLANNFGLSLPTCQGRGICPAMIGNRHREHAQKGGGGCAPRYKSTDELHVIPEGLVLEILSQLSRSYGNDGSEAPSH